MRNKWNSKITSWDDYTIKEVREQADSLLADLEEINGKTWSYDALKSRKVKSAKRHLLKYGARRTAKDLKSAVEEISRLNSAFDALEPYLGPWCPFCSEFIEEDPHAPGCSVYGI